MDFFSIEYVKMVGSVVLIDIILGGDNAVVIALASRNLPAKQQKKAVFWGTTGAIAIRVIFTVVAVSLLKIPLLKLIGGLLLVWIAIKLLTEKQEEHCDVTEADCLSAAIKTIIMADLVMSIDNILALAAVTKGHIPLLLFGLALSVPLIMWGSKLILRLMEKFPVIIMAGAALLGYTAGEMMVADEYVSRVLRGELAFLQTGIPVVTTVGVVVIGRLLQSRQRAGSK